jgi:hypothetical protein
VVQPLGEVNVTLYTPAADTLIVRSVELVLQRTLPLPTAVKLAVGLAQVRVALLGLILNDGVV